MTDGALPHQTPSWRDEPPALQTNGDDDDLPRPPPFLIGVAGGAASGKAAVVKMIMDHLLKDRDPKIVNVVHVKMNDFYRELSAEEHELVDRGDYNFDHPDAFDWKKLEQIMQQLLDGKSVDIPTYDFKNRKRLAETTRIASPDVVIFEGILMLYKKRIRERLSLKVFVDVDSDVRLARQVIRDTEERYNYDLEYVLHQYVRFVKPSFEDYILPSKRFADVIIPRGHENTVAVDLLAQHIRDIEAASSSILPTTSHHHHSHTRSSTGGSTDSSGETPDSGRSSAYSANGTGPGTGRPSTTAVGASLVGTTTTTSLPQTLTPSLTATVNPDITTTTTTHPSSRDSSPERSQRHSHYSTHRASATTPTPSSTSTSGKRVSIVGGEGVGAVGVGRVTDSTEILSDTAEKFTALMK
ncbi:Uridine-cytidine kinase-like 1 [Quaeritorhiza haematococci]|nr:Uridine-cytidine kinase-like 1 [Quaeritorhiza haematococci]